MYISNIVTTLKKVTVSELKNIIDELDFFKENSYHSLKH